MRIAIGGVSNAGKSKLATDIKNKLTQNKVSVLCQDEFVFPASDIPRINDHIDWEIPDSIDTPRFIQAILTASMECDLLIAEGLMIYHHPEINNLFHKRIFIDLPKEEFLTRKRKDLRWGHEPEWYIEHIWKNYLKFGKPPSNENLLILDGSSNFPMETILSFLNIK